jgi:sulfofructose kinase
MTGIVMQSNYPKIDVLGLGAVAVDDLIFVEVYPPPDAKARVVRRERHCGGLTATALVAAARLGGRCAYAGVLGHDSLSEFVVHCLEAEGIDVSRAPRTASAGPVYSNIVIDQRRGTRNIFYDLSQAFGASIRTPVDLIRSCRVLFVDHIGVPGMVRAARLARAAGIPVVADLEIAEHGQFRELLGLADHLIVSQAMAAKLTGAAAPAQSVRRLARADRQIAVVTCGQQGCWYLAQGWATPKHQPAFKVRAVDTTGCGDVFHGAYAFALARGMELPDRIRFAAATAALKATRPGGQAGIPTLKAVQRFLKHEDDHSRG